jgi:hypothetical protein
MRINFKNIILCLVVIVSDQEEPDVPMLSLACLCIAYVCGAHEGGFKDSKGAGGASIKQMGKFTVAWDKCGQGFVSMHPRQRPQIRISYFKQNRKPSHS